MRLEGQHGTTVKVAIRDLSSEEWLSADGWQPDQTTLGGFDVSPSGNILFGPAIVDRIEPYAALEVTIDGKKTRLTWPDNIAASPAGLQSGGLQVTRRREKSPLEGTSTKPVVVRLHEPEPVMQTPTAPGTEQKETSRAPASLSFVVLGLLGLAVIAAFLAYSLRFTAPDLVAPEKVVEEASTDCSSEGFAARASLGYTEQIAVALECSTTAAPEDLLRILEAGVRDNHPDALLRMARLYDPTTTGDGGLALSSRDPAIAAEYYARAAATGSIDTSSALYEVCALLGPENLLHDAIRAEYCPPQKGQ